MEYLFSPLGTSYKRFAAEHRRSAAGKACPPECLVSRRELNGTPRTFDFPLERCHCWYEGQIFGHDRHQRRVVDEPASELWKPAGSRRLFPPCRRSNHRAPGSLRSTLVFLDFLESTSQVFMVFVCSLHIRTSPLVYTLKCNCPSLG